MATQNDLKREVARAAVRFVPEGRSSGSAPARPPTS